MERDDVIKGRRRGPELVGRSFGASGGAGEEKFVEEWKASSLHFLILASSKYLWPHVGTAQSRRAGDEGKKGLSWQQLDRRGPPDQRGRRNRCSCRNLKAWVVCARKGTSASAAAQFFFYYTLAVVRSSGGRIVGETQSVHK